MTTREIETDDGVRWTLTEPLVGTDDEREADTEPVVATPSGGEQTVRLALGADWLEQSDADLARAIKATRDA